MRCTHCNAIIPEGWMRCPRCGKEVQIVPDYNPLDDVLTQEVKGSVEEDRKSTRLNSSHITISYAVFCEPAAFFVPAVFVSPLHGICFSPHALARPVFHPALPD